ncbi:hypothetical protein LAZ67_10002262 [Cordylochernes scorpioides]|uniref:Retrovirus-related Pol polyprotein from transposon TNT 1-94 n=1 Tax=Cordylochernes scorpioides TaxID=51811 RepID=A0ABY6L0D4_9ARAC|nr:hypothetical protein LAZ67_10002262 [Cordylochernes scorpioides]
MAISEPKSAHLREVLLFAFNCKKSAIEAHRMLEEVYSDHALSKSQCYRWFKKFQSGDFELDNEPHGKPPQKFEDAELQALLDEDSTQMQEKLAKQLQVSQGVVSLRLNSLGMTQKLSRWVPHENGSTSAILRAKSRGACPANFQNRRLGPIASEKKAMLCIWWDQTGVVYFELLKPGKMVNTSRYEQQMHSLREALNEKRPEWREKHNNLIRQHDNAPAHNATNHIRHLNSPKEVWDELQRLYAPRDSKHRILQLRRKLYSQKFCQHANMDAYLGSIDLIVSELTGVGDKIEDGGLSMLILCGMPEDWDNVISTMCNLPESEFTSANIRRKLNSNKIQFPHEHQGSKTVRKCFGCGKTGHIARDCFKLKKNNGNQQEKGAIHQNHEAKNLNVMYNAEVVSEENTWVIDSGATHHMTPNRRYSSTLNDDNVGQVTTIDGTSHSNIGRGNAQVDLINNSGQLRSIVAQNAMFVPGIRHGVLSVLQIVENGHEVIFDKKGCHIYDNDHNLMIRAEKRGRLYLVRTAPSRFPESGECSNSIAQTNNFRKFPLYLWHQRLMDINYDTIVDIEVVIGLNCQAGKPDKCSDCMIGKSTKRPFLNLRSTKETQTLALVHCDLMGPFNIESWGGSRFVLTIIDNASRYTRVYFLKRKGDTLEKFKEWMKEAENQTGFSLKRIRTDNGLEFCSSPWDIFTKAHGIVHERTMVYTPEQNGVAERMNRTLLNLVRSSVNSCNLPTASWAELTNTAAYLRNRVTNRHNEEKTPFELWFGKRPALQHLRAIGCETFVHVPKQRRNSKLQPRATKGILVGYSLQGRGWRIWIPEKRQVVESRNCVFKEEILYKQPKRERDTLPSVHFSSKEASFQEESNADQPVDRETEELIGTTGGMDQLSETLPENLRSHPMTLRSHGKTAESPEEDNIGGQINATSAEDNNPTYEEAMNSPEVANWIEAIEEERESLERHDVWQLQELPKGIKPLKCRWVLNKKINAVDGTTRYKARLVAKGFTQRRGIDYNEVYTPVSSFETICWNKLLNKQLHEIGFQRNPIDPSIYEVELEEGRIILLIYVDDIFAISENQAARNKCRELLNSSFEVKYLGPISHMLGVSFKKSEDGSQTLSQSNYIEELLQRFRLQDAKGVSTPMETNLDLRVRKNGNSNERFPYRELIGGLSYLSQRTRPDIAYAVGILSRYCDNYTRKHWEAGKRVLRYLNSTKDFGITYKSTGKPLIAFSDASWASDIVDRKGVSGHLIILAGAPIIWRSTKQTVTALKTKVFCDNQAAISHAENYIDKSKTRHFAVKYHFVREKISEEAIKLFYTPNAENPADFLTKPLAISQHEKYCRALMDYRNKRPAEVIPGGDMLDTSAAAQNKIPKSDKLLLFLDITIKIFDEKRKTTFEKRSKEIKATIQFEVLSEASAEEHLIGIGQIIGFDNIHSVGKINGQAIVSVADQKQAEVLLTNGFKVRDRTVYPSPLFRPSQGMGTREPNARSTLQIRANITRSFAEALSTPSLPENFEQEQNAEKQPAQETRDPPTKKRPLATSESETSGQKIEGQDKRSKMNEPVDQPCDLASLKESLIQAPQKEDEILDLEHLIAGLPEAEKPLNKDTDEDDESMASLSDWSMTSSQHERDLIECEQKPNPQLEKAIATIFRRSALIHNTPFRTRIDYIHCSTSFTPNLIKCETIAYDLSDHNAIITRLRTRNTQFFKRNIDSKIFNSHIFKEIFLYEHESFITNFNYIGAKAHWRCLKKLISETAEVCQKYTFTKFRRLKPAITAIYNDNNEFLNNNDAILNYIFAFYQNKTKAAESIILEDIRNYVNIIPRLDIEFHFNEENFITKNDILNAIKLLPNRKMAGDDGIPVEFYKDFCDIAADSLLEIFYEAQLENSLPDHMSAGKMFLLPKTPNTRTLNDWRPITSMNTDYKILSKILLTKIKPYSARMIPTEQKYAIPGRSIFDIIPEIEKNIYESNLFNTPLAIVTLDLQKAFDSINRPFIIATLERLDIPDIFLKWIKIVFSGNKIKIDMNGECSPEFDVNRGVRQGCGLSALLFSFATTSLIHHLRRNLSSTSEIYAYADDFILFLKDETDFKRIYNCFKNFEKTSGIAINFKKSKGLWCGNWSSRTDRPEDIEMRNDTIDILGIHFENSKTPLKMQTENLRSYLHHSALIAKQNILTLPLHLKTRFLNANFIPKFTYMINAILPSDSTLNELQKDLDDALYNETTWTTSSINCLPAERGGLGLLHLATQRDLFILKRIQRSINGEKNENDFLFVNKNSTNYYNLFNYDLHSFLSPRRKQTLSSWKNIAPNFHIDFKSLSKNDFLHIVLLKCRLLHGLYMQNPAIFNARGLRRLKDFLDLNGEIRDINDLFSHATRNIRNDFQRITTFYNETKIMNFKPNNHPSCVHLPITYKSRLFSRFRSSALRQIIISSYFNLKYAEEKTAKWTFDTAPCWHKRINIYDDIAWRLKLRALPYPTRNGKASCTACGGPPDIQHRYTECAMTKPFIDNAIKECRNIDPLYRFNPSKFILEKEKIELRRILNRTKYDIYKFFINVDFNCTPLPH